LLKVDAPNFLLLFCILFPESLTDFFGWLFLCQAGADLLEEGIVASDGVVGVAIFYILENPFFGLLQLFLE